MLIITKTEELSMNILSLKEETFDSFLLESEKIHKKVILETLKRWDDDIYSSIDRKRFVFIRFDTRTILSSYGIIQ